MKWPKDRKKAFLAAAEAFGTPYNERTEKQSNLTRGGFCLFITKLTGSDLIYDWANNVGSKMRLDVWWWGFGDSCDKERSLFCSQMAALSDKEFEELNT